MEAKKEYKRVFLIFTNEDKGYEMGDKPSGYVKMEVRDGKGKLHAIVQNLRSGYEKFIYKLYLIKVGADGLTYVCAGRLTHGPNKAELEWSFDPRNMGESGFDMNDFMLAAILVEYADRLNDRAICPLAAYRNGRIDWRSGFRLAMQKKKAAAGPVMPDVEQQMPLMQIPLQQSHPFDYMEQKENKPIYIQPLYEQSNVEEQSEAEGKAGPQHQIQSNTQPESQLQLKQEQPKGVQPKQEAEGQFQKEPPLASEKQPIQKQPTYDQPKEAKGAEQEQTKKDHPKPMEKEQTEEVQPKQAEQGQTKEVQPKQAEQGQSKEDQPKQAEQGQSKEDQPKQAEQEQPEEIHPEQEQAEGKESPESKPQPDHDAMHKKNFEQINTGCVYLNGNMCGAVVNTGVAGSNPCDACHMQKNKEQYVQPAVGNVTQLKEEFNRYFEVSDPFHSRRSDYIWWRVTNPVNLNNLLYQCNIRSPLLFNPVVMMAHYKYGHLIIGIFQHKETQKQYVVCGVPGMNMVDRKPFGEMSRWVQAEGSRPRYGAFGYWLVYINPDDGKMLNMI